GYCPIDENASAETVSAFALAASVANITIAEVGAWSNPISPDEATRRSAVRYCQERLALAERIGARCCVNIPGSLSDVWFGPHSENYSTDTFDLIVDTVRDIIDAVKP